jgi:Tfp pilus assembly protein PilW
MTPARRRRGVSLVSLMVALALAMICLVTALQAYRTMVVGSRSASTSARSTGSASALAVQLGRVLPAAGWGMGADKSPPGGTMNQDLVLLADATLSSSGRLSGSVQTLAAGTRSGNALAWSSLLDGTLKCSALVSSQTLGLRLLGPKACANAAAGINSSWNDAVVLAPAGAFPLLVFEVASSDCWPYGGPLRRSAASVHVAGVRGTLPGICLPNIHGS